MIRHRLFITKATPRGIWSVVYIHMHNKSPLQLSQLPIWRNLKCSFHLVSVKSSSTSHVAMVEMVPDHDSWSPPPSYCFFSAIMVFSSFLYPPWDNLWRYLFLDLFNFPTWLLTYYKHRKNINVHGLSIKLSENTTSTSHELLTITRLHKLFPNLFVKKRIFHPRALNIILLLPNIVTRECRISKNTIPRDGRGKN